MGVFDQAKYLRRRAIPVPDTGELPNILRAPEAPQEPLIKRIRWNRVLVIVAIVYLLVSFMYGSFSILDLKDQENMIQIETRKALEEQKALQEQIAYLQTEEAVEQIAREQLGMVRPGEVLITQQEAKPADTDLTQVTE